jgi:hypothetical protein
MGRILIYLLEANMNEFERLIREWVKGKVERYIVGKPDALVEYLIFAYLGGMVLVIDQYQMQNIYKGAALDQFLELAIFVCNNTGEMVVDNIYDELKLLVNIRLDSFEALLSADDRTYVSSVVAMTVSV